MSRRLILLKIVSESRFSGKTYFYTIASRRPRKGVSDTTFEGKIGNLKSTILASKRESVQAEVQKDAITSALSSVKGTRKVFEEEDRDELYKNRSSRKWDFLETFSLTENRFSGKTYTYLYTILSSLHGPATTDLGGTTTPA